jgi:hypothetical protein
MRWAEFWAKFGPSQDNEIGQISGKNKVSSPTVKSAEKPCNKHDKAPGREQRVTRVKPHGERFTAEPFSYAGAPCRRLGHCQGGAQCAYSSAPWGGAREYPDRLAAGETIAPRKAARLFGIPSSDPIAEEDLHITDEDALYMLARGSAALSR